MTDFRKFKLIIMIYFPLIFLISGNFQSCSQTTKSYIGFDEYFVMCYFIKINDMLGLFGMIFVKCPTVSTMYSVKNSSHKWYITNSLPVSQVDPCIIPYILQ